MIRNRSLAYSAFFAATLMQCAAAQTTSIPSGRYICKAGNSRMMLTLGEMQVAGTSYRFHAPTGADTTGGFQTTPRGIVWSGDIGAITNGQIVESGLDATPNAFYFTYRARPTSLPTTASCAMM